MVKSVKKFNLLIILSLFITIYQPPIVSINLMHVVGLFSILYLLAKHGIHVRFRVLEWKLLFSFISIFLYLVTTVVIRNNKNLLNSIYPLYFIFNVIPFGIATKQYSDAHGATEIDFLNLCIFIALIQAFLSILAFIIPSVQGVFINMLLSYGYEKSYIEMMTYRAYGLSNGLTYATPVYQSVLAVIAFVYPSSRSLQYKVIGVLLTFSALINARVSLIVISVGSLSYFVFSRDILKKKFGLLLAIIMVGVIFSVLIMPLVQISTPATYDWVIHGLEDIASIFGKERSSYSYFNYLTDKTRFGIPQDLLGLLFGKGSTVMGGRGGFGISSDIGYVNDVWLGGIPFAILNMVLFLYIFRKLRISNIRLISFVGTFLIILTPIINIKGNIYSTNSLMHFSVLMIIFCQPMTVESVRLVNYS